MNQEKGAELFNLKSPLYMKQSLIVLIICVSLCLFSFGCASLVMPYAEEPLCKKGIAGGYCGSLSDVYEISEMEHPNKKPKNKVQGGYLQ